MLDRPLKVIPIDPSRPLRGHTIENVPATSQLLATCREAHNEGLSVLYSENDIKINDLLSLVKFPNIVGEKATACIQTQHLKVNDWDPDTFRHSLSFFRHFSGLKVIKLGPLRRWSPRTMPPRPEPASMASSPRCAQIMAHFGPPIPSFSREMVNQVFGRDGVKAYMLFSFEVCQYRKSRPFAVRR